MQIGLGKNFQTNALGAYSKEGCDLVFIPIFKNAHTWGVQFLKTNYNFSKLDKPITTTTDQFKYLVFLRDPIERWYSGAAQCLWGTYLDNRHHEEVLLDQNTIKFMFSAVRLDPHTDLQRRFVMNLNFFDVYFFNLSDTRFYSNLTQWLHNMDKVFNLNKTDTAFVESDPVNTSEDSKLKTSIIEQLKLAAKKNPEYIENLKNFYKPDYELLEYSSRFMYNKGKWPWK